MVTVAQVLEWRPDLIDSLAEYFLDKRRDILRLADEVQGSAPPSSWDAPAKAAAEKKHQDLRLRLNDLAADVSKLAVTLKETGSKAKGVQGDLQDVLHDATGKGFTIDHQTGEIHAPEIVVQPDPKYDNDPAYQQGVKPRVL